MGRSDSTERSQIHERAVLGVLLEEPERFSMAGELSPDHFSLSDHRTIFRAIQKCHARNEPADIVAVVAEVGSSVAPDYVASLIDGVVSANFGAYVSRVRAAAQDRQFDALCELAANAESAEKRCEIVGRMQSLLQSPGGTAETIDSYEAIGDAMAMKLDYVEPLIDGLLGRGTVNLLSGDPGVGKSYVADRLGIGVALGSEFLGLKCLQQKVLILDKENPLALVQKRLSLMAGGDIPGLKIWGGWLKDPPAMIGDPRLLQMARRDPILFIFDSFVRFHEADENSASEMRTVMGHVRALADAGSTVLLLHHRPKSQEILYRGSSDILAGVDVAFSLEKDSDALKLVGYKDRDSQLRTFGIRVDFARGKFLSTDTEAVMERKDAVATLLTIIEAEPGISQNKILQRSGLRHGEAVRLLRQKDGVLWRSERGKYGAITFSLKPATETSAHNLCPRDGRAEVGQPLPEVPQTSAGGYSHCAAEVDMLQPLPSFSTPKSGKREEAGEKAAEKPNGKAPKTLPSCPACGGFALYPKPDGTMICETCVGYV